MSKKQICAERAAQKMSIRKRDCASDKCKSAPGQVYNKVFMHYKLQSWLYRSRLSIYFVHNSPSEGSHRGHDGNDQFTF